MIASDNDLPPSPPPRSPRGGGVESAAGSSSAVGAAVWPVDLFVLRGDDRADLARRVAVLDEYLARRPGVTLADLAFTLSTGLAPGGARLAVVAGSAADLRGRLGRAAQRLADPGCVKIRDHAGIYFTEDPLGATGGVALLFPGEGAHYLNMLGDLPGRFAAARQVVAVADGIAAAPNFAGSPLSRFLQRERDQAARAADEAALRRLGNAMFSALSGDAAIYFVLKELGLGEQARFIAGHSAGEMAALMAADCLRDDLAVMGELVNALQALEVEQADAPTALLALGVSRAAAEELLARLAAEARSAGRAAPSAQIAMDNCPHQTILVGGADMAEVEQALQARGWVYERLSLSHPYHTPAFQPYMHRLADVFAHAPFAAPTRPLYSCATAAPFPSDPTAIRELALAHWVKPVEFTRLARRLHQDGARLFVEVGPRGNLSTFVEDILRGEQFVALPCDTPRRNGVTQLLHVVGQLLVHQVELRLDALYRERPATRLRGIESLLAAETAPSRAAPLVPAALVPTAPPVIQQAVVPRAAPEDAEALARAAADAPREAVPDLEAAADWEAVPAPAALEALAAGGDLAAPAPSAPRPNRASDREAVLLDHFAVMRRFLDGQRDVLEQYLALVPEGPVGEVASRDGDLSWTPAGWLDGDANAGFAEHAAFAPDDAEEHDHAEEQNAGLPPWPMLGEIVRHVPGEELVLRRRLDLSEDVFAAEHTIGGRMVSRVDPAHCGLPIGPMTFTLELMAEAAALLFRGQVVTAIEDVRLFRWLAYDAELLGEIELAARRLPGDAADATRVRVELKVLPTAALAPGETGGPAAEGVVTLRNEYPPAPRAAPMTLTNRRPSIISLRQLYDDLFHGDLLKGVVGLGDIGDEGIVGQAEVLPRQGLFRSTDDPAFLLDPVLLDVLMHPLCAWHLEQPDLSGRTLIPFALRRAEFFGPCPPAGARFVLQGRVEEQSPKHFVHTVEAHDAQGRVWARMGQVKYWRFYMPWGKVKFHGRKDEYFISAAWPKLTGDAPGAYALIPEASADNPPPRAIGVRLEPPLDMLQPGLQLVMAQVTLAPKEMKHWRGMSGLPKDRYDWVFQRMAAKDAVRVLWRYRDGVPWYPVDVELVEQPDGRLRAQYLGDAAGNMPWVSMAGCDKMYVAAAAFSPRVGVGLVKALAARADEARAALGDDERARLAALPDADAALFAWAAAKQAAARALGAEPRGAGGRGAHPIDLAVDLRVRGFIDGGAAVEVEVAERLARRLADRGAGFPGRTLAARLARHGDFVAAAVIDED